LISALLALEDGTIFSGKSIGVNGATSGEVVFNTAMTGYQEILTDPSYFKQLVTLTYPHIGNTGTNKSDFESPRAFAAGLIIRDLSPIASSWRKENDLGFFLKTQNIVAIADIDTRKLTNHIRSNGALRGCIINSELNEQSAIKKALEFPGLSGLDLAKAVTTDTPYNWNKGQQDIYGSKKERPSIHFHVVAYDFGIKQNILRLLVDHGCRVTVIPAMTTAEEVLSMKPDGVFLSNGPGDPEPCVYAISAIQKLLKQKIPIFGICLGHQLLALASGAKTIKMKFGHHGANHPVQDLKTGQVLITSQNHGFTVNENTLPNSVKVTHRSLFDQSLQGIELKDFPAFSFQGHPEASPGPHDLSNLFEQFITNMKRCQNDKI
jgi:carbamoyl-phosphate synthase small subunit